MAEIVTGAMGSLLPKLANLIKKEYNQQKKLRGEIMFLETELRSMEAALIKVSEAPIDQPPDMQVKLWTREVRELSYDLEDTIDKFMVRVGDGKPHSFKGFIDRSLDLLTRCTIKHKIGLDIKEIRSRIKDVSEQRNRYKVDLVPSKPVGRSIDSLRLSALDRKATELVGAEEKSVDLEKRLMEGGEASMKQPVVLSIVGFGGLGKTTLANLVYEKLKGQFDCGAFVYVSHNPDVVKIFKDMLYQLDGNKYKDINQGTWSEEQLIRELRKFLQDKRYFIVVDDIWNTSVWEAIQCALIQNECGSRIITTTRNLDVAKQAGSVYQLEPLSLTDSTKLFCQRIFGSEDKCPPDNLVEVAGKILKKCGGVPLAIITMASMLANKTGKEINTHYYWSNVYQSMGSGLDGSNDDVKDMRRILSVSYYNLPSHLKTCLLYLSSFPEDYEIKIKHLIWKWIGEGFVHEEQGKTLYEVGEDYIEELVNRSMIQPVDIGRDGKTVSCLIHDMVHDLISFLSNEEQFLTKVGGQQPISLPKKIRRLSLQISQKEEVNQLAAGTSFSHVRSLIVSGRAFQLMPNISSFLVLRVLDLRGYGGVMNHHFRDICNMFHLRYLNTGRNSITEIPKEIQNLQFLQVLDMSVRSTQRMPSTFIHLRQLLQLRCYGVRLPDGFGKLISLQEVRTITIESPSMLCDLGCLTELRTLAIEFCDWDESYGESFIQCLSNLVNLKSMEIKGTMMSSLCSEHDNLYPGPQQLCSIDMESGGSVITAVPRWMSSLCFLSTINIRLLTLGEQDIQVLGSIPSLSDLSIYVKKTTQDRDGRLVIGKSYPFQCLTKMSIVYPSMAVVFAPGGMQNLKELHLEFLVKEVLRKFGDCNLGLEHLLSLEHVSISVERTTPKKVEAVKDEIRKALDMNPGKPTWRLTTLQYDSQFSVDCSMFECGSFASRSSIRLVHEVVSKFDLQKGEVVKSIGFEGILHFPPIKQYNRKFALWLMSCVNEEFSSLVIGQHMSISFTKGDVGHVFGIPSSGKSVLDLTVCSREAKDRVLQTFLGAEFKDHRSIKLVQEVVEREYSVPMTKSETDTFRVAFVVFVVSNLLCPSAKYDYASIDYWNAIQDPDAIITYDWAEYVIVRLLEAVSKLKQDVSSNIKFPNISGCSIFLQVLYLDSLDIPGLAMPHNNFPRIRDFSYEKLRSMILADKNYAKHKSSDVALPAGKLRPKSECIYSWAKDQGSDNDEPRSEWLFAIWESAVAMVHLLNIPLEAAGPVFVAAADFQQQINSGLSITGTQAIKFMSVLVSIMIPYTRGFSYQPSYSLDPALSGFDALESAITNGITLMSSPISHTRKANSDTTHGQCSISKPSNMKHMLSTRSNTSEASTSTQGWATLDHTFIGDHVQRSFNSARSSLDDTPHNLNVNLRVATAMSQFYSLLRRFKPARGFDLNTCVPHEDTSLQSPTLILHSVSGVLPNPWHLGYAWSNDGVKTTRAYDKLNSIEDDDRLAIIHRNPKYIQVSSLALRDQFTGKREFELDLFDALIRAVRQQDDLMYAPFGNLRWRIFFESDFMEAILSGPSDLLHRSLCEHLSLADCTYDLSKTKLMFFPALLQCRWVCFVWSIENNVISVFEPSHGAPVPESRVEAIERSCFLLNLAMHTLSRSVFHGLSHEAMCADMRLLTLSYISAPLCFNRSGALCSFFCRCYDGGDLTPRPSELDADTIAAKLLNEIVDLKDNSGTIPPQLKAESLSASPAR